MFSWQFSLFYAANVYPLITLPEHGTRSWAGQCLPRRASTRRLYSTYWPKATTGEIADKLNNAPKFVASRSRRKLEWNNSTLIQGDLSKEVARIKQKHGEVHVMGSGNLVQTLLRDDLVDRFNLWVYPLLLGTGKRLFSEGTVPTGLRLTSSQAFPKGAIHLAYERAGKPKHGDLSVEADRTALL